MLSSNKLFVVIVGCGRLGSHLANNLSRSGHSIVSIDVNESAFDSLSAEYSGFRVIGDATEIAVLKQAKADKADLIIVTTRDDNVNLMISQIAKRIFHTPKVMARVFEPKQEEIYHSFDIETVCPTFVASELFLDLITGSLVSDKKGNKE